MINSASKKLAGQKRYATAFKSQNAVSIDNFQPVTFDAPRVHVGTAYLQQVKPSGKKPSVFGVIIPLTQIQTEIHA